MQWANDGRFRADAGTGVGSGPLTQAEKVLYSHLDKDYTETPKRGESYLLLRCVCGLSPWRSDGKLTPTQPGPGVPAGRDGADGAAADHGIGHRPRGAALDGALRPPAHSARRGRGRLGQRQGREQGGVQLPAHRLVALRPGLLRARLGHHPPGGAGELRAARPPHHRRGLAHAQRRRRRHGRHRCGRRRHGGRHDGPAVGAAGAQGHRRRAHGRAFGLGFGACPPFSVPRLRCC